MKLSRLLALLAGLALGLPAGTAHAADPGLSLSVAQRWDAGSQTGTWAPYVVTLKNDGPADFTGDVRLVPNVASRNQAPTSGWPRYRARLTVPKAGSRSATIYVVEAASGYGAEVRDLGGHVVAQAEQLSINRTPTAAALLSDVQQGDQKITTLRPLPRGYDFSMTRFASAQAFPTNAVYLTGLAAIVVDEFDSASLSQAQVQALRDFVGLGGSLVLAGGSSWRRTLQPLPADLLPMRPEASGTAPVDPLTQLAGRASDLVVPTVTGALQSGRSVVGAPDGSPLIVEGRYGAGRIVELAVDPFADPLDGQPSLAGIVWSQAMARGLLTASPTGRLNQAAGGFGGVGPAPAASGGNGSGGLAAAPGSYAPGFNLAGGQDVISGLLSDAPAGALPPIGLLGGLLVAYVLLAGLLNYAALKAVRRRELMWVTVPLVALAFTGGSYLVGSATRGTDFFDNQIQVQRLAPGGAVETYAFHGIFAPRRGDYVATLPANTLASTVVGFNNSQASADDSEISVGQRTQVDLKGVAVWSMKTVQTLAVSHQPGLGETPGTGGLEAHLAIRNGRLVGSVLNRTAKPLEGLRAITAGGQEAVLAAGVLNPGQTAAVDASLDAAAGPQINPKTGLAQPFPAGQGYPGYNGDKRESVLRLAAAEAATGRPGDVALVAMTPAVSALQVAGVTPARGTLAAVVQPLGLESVDSLSALPLRTRLVSMASNNSYSVDVYDTDLPPGAAASGLSLSYFFPPVGAGNLNPPVRALDVYDWATGKWRALQQVPATGGRGLTAPVNGSETLGGVVRVRVEELNPQTSQVAVMSPP